MVLTPALVIVFLLGLLLARAATRRAASKTVRAASISSYSSFSSSSPSDASSGGQVDEGCAKELSGELPASGDDEVLTQEEVGALLDGFGDFRGGTGKADEDGDGSFLSCIRDLENKKRAADLDDLDP
jgi:hypothetical protein